MNNDCWCNMPSSRLWVTIVTMSLVASYIRHSILSSLKQDQEGMQGCIIWYSWWIPTSYVVPYLFQGRHPGPPWDVKSISGVNFQHTSYHCHRPWASFNKYKYMYTNIDTNIKKYLIDTDKKDTNTKNITHMKIWIETYRNIFTDTKKDTNIHKSRTKHSKIFYQS